MNNEQQGEQQKAIRRFFIGSFFIALLCAAVVDLFLASMDGSSSDDVVWVFFYTFFIVFIPSTITTFVFYITQGKASSYYSRYLVLALLMPPFLIPILATLFDLIYLNSWHDAIDTLVEYYLAYGIWACILAVVQLVLAAICLP
jgi:hypothetical protein